MKIASDFTAGSSGGPWTVGEGSPTVLSLTDYGYEEEPGYLYGPYFGSTAQDVYEEVEAATEEEQTTGGGGSGSNEPAMSASAGQAQPTESKSRNWLRLVGIRRNHGAGTVILLVEVSGAGKLRLGGREVRASSLSVQKTGRFSLPLRARGSAAKKLRSAGHMVVGVQISFWPAGQPELTKNRLVRLAMN